MEQPPRHASQHPVRTARRPQNLRHQLELRVDANPFWMSALRALTTDLAIRADFDLDSVADLTLAVDEACAMLIDIAEADAALLCRFAITADEIVVTVTLPAGWAGEFPGPRTDTFGWRVMVTLTDEAELIDSGSGTGDGLTIRLAKYRIPASD